MPAHPEFHGEELAAPHRLDPNAGCGSASTNPQCAAKPLRSPFETPTGARLLASKPAPEGAARHGEPQLALYYGLGHVSSAMPSMSLAVDPLNRVRSTRRATTTTAAAPTWPAKRIPDGMALIGGTATPSCRWCSPLLVGRSIVTRAPRPGGARHLQSACGSGRPSSTLAAAFPRRRRARRLTSFAPWRWSAPGAEPARKGGLGTLRSHNASTDPLLPAGRLLLILACQRLSTCHPRHDAPAR